MLPSFVPFWQEPKYLLPYKRVWWQGRKQVLIGSELQRVDHFTPSLVFKVDQQEALRKGLLSEVEKGRMVGPLKTPIIDNRWFSNTWVSPYFTTPKLTAEGKIRKWLLIHHLSYHVLGSRAYP